MASFFTPLRRYPLAGRLCVWPGGVVGNEPSALMCPADIWLRDEKRALRRVMSSRRDELSADQRGRFAQAATDLLLDLPEVATARVVAGFVSTRSEIDTSRVIDGLRRRGVTVALPRVSAELLPPRLRFHRVEGPSELVFGIFGLLEPGPGCPEIAPHDIDVFLVPGLAFDARGGRVGYGGGYYDELMAYVRAHPDGPSGFFVGFGYDFQLAETCPTGEWDVPIDCLVTDARVVRCGSAPE
jgi:5-formyltetrahydrofolate cyclo-ligase